MTNNNDFGKKQYLKSTLNLVDLNIDPYIQFDIWYKEILQFHIDYPNAMILSTANSKGIPSSRVVLLKGYDEKGFCFYTDSRSEKGRDLFQNPNASLCFWWPVNERQLRIDGEIELIVDDIVDDYFKSRPRGSQIAASISRQSKVVESREHLEKLYFDFESIHEGEDIERPDFWKGYLLKPNSFEFWQGRKNRLHDRFRYTVDENKSWKIERLYP